MRAYEGDKPYIFVSYAHKDSERVFSVLEELMRRGYRIWYDEGIEPGSEWPENIAQHLMKADTFIAFISENSMKSANCRREINFALSKDIPFLTIMLEKTDIPPGMELQISAQQSILKYNYSSDERFYDKVESCSFLNDCKGEPEQLPPRLPEFKPNKKAFPLMPVLIGVAALIAVLGFLFFPKSQPVEDPQGKPTDTTPKDEKIDIDNKTDNSAVSWVYKISRDDSGIVYTFDRGPVITLPTDWDGKIEVLQVEDRIDFYHEASRNAWKLEGYNGGLLFSLNFSENQDYLNNPSYQDVGSTEEGYYYLTFPTDIQSYYSNARIDDEYIRLWSEIDYIRKNVRMN